MIDRNIDLNRAEAFTEILPSVPDFSSHQAGWENFFLAYYDGHPGYETPQSTFHQHALEIIDVGGESDHHRCLGEQHFSHRLQEGEICFCPAKTTHWTRWEQPLSFTVITFESDLFTRIVQQMYSNSDRLELRPQWQIFDPTIQAIVQALKADLAAKCPAGRLYGESFGTSLAVHLVKSFSVVPLKKPDLATFSRKKQQEVLDFIEAHLDTDIQLEDLAKIAGISKFYFCHLFKQAIQIPPHQYIIRRRIERAKQLLKHSDLTTVEIALSCGFAHQSHLSRHFKRIVGISPQKFRLS